ncbi:Integrase [hydrothermal vent metagenome]|uniref:Integrase n=2 Tax=hydrothermal vent metagenome TaxID=652676 RepID=A0A1W1C1H0_9ZZZZ
MTTNKLTAKMVQSAKPKKLNGVLKDNYIADGGGLYLIVTAKGGKLWRYHYSFQNKKYRLALGKYPFLSLKEARKLHKEAQIKKANGINPVEERRVKKLQNKKEQKNSFREVAEDYFKKRSSEIAPSTLKKHVNAMKKDFYPIIGNKPIDKIERAELVRIAQTIQERGANETAHRLINLCSQIWRYALQLDKVKHNIVADISKNDVLQSFKHTPMRTITDPQRIGELMRALHEYHGEYSTKWALLFMAHTFVRSSNIRFAEWEEIDFKKRVWIIPSHKMKAKAEHTLPLSNQAISILRAIEPYTKDSKYIFPSPLSRSKTLSENTLNTAFKRLGFGSEMVSHGFRSMFSTLAYENGKFRGEVIEMLLAHKDPNKIRRAYNRATYEDEKREVIEWWSGFLEGVRNG